MEKVGRTLTMLSSEMAGQFYATVLMAQFIALDFLSKLFLLGVVCVWALESRSFNQEIKTID